MTVAKVEGPRRGRPRLQATDQAIYTAAAELIAERGFDGFSMAAVADRAGVAKTTVYRRWPTRSHLVLETMTSVMRVSLMDSGDLRADLVTFARTLANGLRAPGSKRLVAEVAVATCQRPELADAFQQLYSMRRADVVATVERAKASGELRGDCDPEMLIDQLSGALHYRMLLGEGPTESYAERLVDAVLEGALAARPDV
jgi:AcrR family transcriptional regulator